MKHESPLHILNSPLLHLEPATISGSTSEYFWSLTSPLASANVSLDFLKEHQSHFRHETVVVFHHAKPLLRTLLKHDIDIARPVCLETLEQISFSKSSDSKIQGGDAFDRLEDLLNAVESYQCKALARLECLVLRAFASMEGQGLYVDAKAWSQAIAQKREIALSAAKKCEELLAPFTEQDLFGNAIFSLNQPEEMRGLLEKALSRPISGISNEALSNIDHPLVAAFLEYREANKLISTYGDRFLEQINPDTRRIHPDFNPLGSATGRVSCHKPNLQNLPSDPLFDRCITAPAGRALVCADFSACELRILAGLAGDANFLHAINSKEDFHSKVAAQLFNTEVSKNENAHLRQRAKAINFGIIYGMGAKGLAHSLDLAEDEAQAILTRYFSQFPLVRDYLENCVASAKRLGYARTLLGRRLYFEKAEKGSTDDISRIAKNMPIQGSAAELAKLAMTRVHERLNNEFRDAYLVNMIHDELVVECEASDKEAVGQALKAEMQGSQETLFSNVRPEVEVFFR